MSDPNLPESVPPFCQEFQEACFLQIITQPETVIAVQFGLYGIYAILYAMCIFLLTSKRSSKYVLHCLLMSVLFVLVTTGLVINTVVSTRETNANLVTYAFNPLDPASSGLEQVEKLNKLTPVGQAVTVTANLIADIILIWRCYLVWEADLNVVALPALFCLGNNVLAFVTVHQAIHSDIGSPFYSGVLGVGLFDLNSKLFLAFIFGTLVSNLLVTLLIAGRILYISRKMRASAGPRNSRMYSTIVAITLESGVLYPFALIVYAVTTMIFRFAPFDQAMLRDVRMALVSEVMASSLLQFVGIAPTLIIVRTGLGVAIQDTKSSMESKQDSGDNGRALDISSDVGRLSMPMFASRGSVESQIRSIDLEAQGKRK
ncbi:hypothetical protein WG66_006216 [Moniliophthora roreri]|uniref:Uncharacterized protein n=1 Tax=Moniliophthora roreri TaxID=221103 RepID=A0A0W0FV83_MONRR|nr:hypothetical protein WG66_006216 [Moniliophthora roreri]